MASGRGFALVTGASWGLGTEFVRQLAREGYDLVLTARSEDRLQRLQAELSADGRVVHVVPADLASGSAPGALEAFTRDRQVQIELLVNNAGFGSGGEFADQDLERELRMVDTNIRALVELSYRFLKSMRTRGQGTIMNVASVAGFTPVPFMATYASTKAFVLNFSQALYYENRKHGVHVMAVCPGTTDTHFFEAAGMNPRTTHMQSAQQVVQEALLGLRKRRPLVVTGFSNRAVVAGLRLAPRSLALEMTGKAMNPKKS